MQDMQTVFNEIREMKKEMKQIREMYKDALAQTDDYDQIVEEAKILRDKKKQIETKVQNQMGKSYEKFEDLKSEVAANEELLNDIAMTTLMDGKMVEVVDEYSNKYEPVYVVKFKKTNEIKTEEKE
jgi:gas vesicle protein